MIRYSPEQKAEALKMVEEVGVSKTSEAMGISSATLFKWKRETGTQAPSRQRTKAAAKKPAVQRGASKKAAVEAAKELLKDDGASAKLRQLEAENADLRDTNAKLRKALAALLD